MLPYMGRNSSSPRFITKQKLNCYYSMTAMMTLPVCLSGDGLLDIAVGETCLKARPALLSTAHTTSVEK